MKYLPILFLLFLTACGQVVDKPKNNILIGDSITKLLPVTPDGYDNLGEIGQDSHEAYFESASILDHRDVHTVVIAIGINDIYHGNSIDDFSSVYENIVALYRMSGATVFCRSILPTGHPELNGRVVEFNVRIKAIAEKYGAYYLDTWSAFALPDGSLATENTRDGIHLTGAGYKIYERVFFSGE